MVATDETASHSGAPGTAPDGLDFLTSQHAEREKRKLRKEFGRLDVLFFLVCGLVSLDTIGTLAKTGAQSFTWLIVLAAAFFVPYGLLTAELGSAFPEEGGPYVWARLAFGRLAGALVAVVYWISNPIWIGGALSVTALAVADAFFHPLGKAGRYGFAFVFIWFTVASAIASPKVGNWVSAAGAWARVLLLTLFTLSIILYARRHGLHGFEGGDFLPSYGAFIVAVPLLIFSFVGFELPSSAGDELKDPRRDVPYGVARSAVATVLLYAAPLLAVLLVLPREQITGLSGLADALKSVFTVYGGEVAPGGTAVLRGAGAWVGGATAIAFILALAAGGASWLIGADRVLAVAAYDGAGPAAVGIFAERLGTPIVANLLSGLVSTVVMILAFSISDGNANKYFSAGLNLAASTTTMSYVAVFPALVRLRKLYPDRHRPYRVPGGTVGLWLCMAVPLLWTLLATLGLIWPGFGAGLFPGSPAADTSLPTGFEHHRLQYEITQLVPLLAILATGLYFYAAGRQSQMPAQTEPR